MTQELKDVLDRLRGLDPEEIRSRLLEIEDEEKALRILLRTTRAARFTRKVQPADSQEARK